MLKGLEQVGGSMLVTGLGLELWGQGSAVGGDALALLAADDLHFNSAKCIAVPVALHRSFP